MKGRAGLFLALLVSLAGSGCRRDASPSPGATADAVPPQTADADATRLGREIFTLIDRAAEYRVANRGRAARSMRQLGMDSLTPELARWVGAEGNRIVAGAAFRKTAGHAWVSCEAGEDALEQAALGGGRYELLCTDAAGVRSAATAGSLGGAAE